MSKTKLLDEKRIRRRIALWWCVIAALLAWMIIVGETGGDSRMMTDLADRMGRILYFGGMIYAVTN